jgi:uncharacterized membrane protein
MAGESHTTSSEEKQTGRVEAFSDGVFGVALTLLVLDLKVPELSIASGPQGGLGKQLVSQLVSQWPAYLAFVTSFFSVLVMWIHHHRVFRLVNGVDATLLFANGFLLLMVVVVPFPTAVISKYLDTPAGNAACAFYGVTFAFISLGFYLMMKAAFRPGIVSPRASAAAMRRFCRGYTLGPPFYLAATLIAPITRWGSMAIFTGLWILWLVTATEGSPGGKLRATE